MKKRFKSIVSIVTMLAIIFTIMPTTFVAAKASYKTEEIVEVEDVFSVRNAVQYESSEYASGGSYAVLKGEDVSSPQKITDADFEISFDIEKNGNYVTYIRVMFPQNTNDKLYIAWDYKDWNISEYGSTANTFKSL